jgi:hypothetical protein
MSAVDRAALIEAMGAVPTPLCDCADCNALRLDAVLPVIADAIETLKVREFDPDASDLALAAGVVGNGHLDRAAELVRSLLSTDSDK